MKKFFLIACLFFFHPAFPQVKKVKKVVWRNEALQSFFLYTKQPVPCIAFKRNYQGELEYQPGNIGQPLTPLVYDNWYSAAYAGHRYLFEKDYAALPTGILLNKLDSLRQANCYADFFEGKIYADHIDIKVTSDCPGKSGDADRIFYKVENRPGYLGGPALLQQVVSDRLACTNYKSFLNGDSAFFFKVLIKKDSLSYEAKPADTVLSPLRVLIQNALTNTYGWKPYNKDGRNMNAYLQVFINLRRDGTVIADYLR